MNAVRWGLLVLGFVVFVGWVVYGSASGREVTCEVCLDFGRETVCRMGSADTEEGAADAAQESACGGNTTGMADMIACRNRRPTRMSCSSS